ncbi:MAG: polyphosphate polymerase domain-containing protein [Oscillospiraceae bacterium]|nr:polyphosphate polymerase domain-containing protein [Oscillospiraceae bacterium]
MDFRHEIKHEISYSDMLVVRQRLRAVAKPDSHAVNGRYFIRSLYFDNLNDKALREKLDGVNCREKFRIRCYNNDFSLIHLEKKSKLNGLGSKQSADLTADEVRRIISGDTDWMIKSGLPLVQELYSKMKTQGLKPKTIVDYTREPFVYPAGNVRVTLDYDIRTGILSTDFFNEECLTVPVREQAVVMEVKWDEFLPSVIKDAVQLDGRRSTAFSKYAVCRVYG